MVTFFQGGLVPFRQDPRDLESNQAPQFLPRGRNVNWSPSLMTSTSDVSNRHAAGRRTAWLRPLQKTLATPR